ncbi:MAG TPA: SNF2-related protein, partial [Acidimicrobiales bacterium]|nr:SNF2-related protein [Acidimicrobiales bacterium]
MTVGAALPAGCEVAFLPGDPPRTGVFVVYEHPGSIDGDRFGRDLVLDDEIEVILPRGTSVRRQSVRATRMPLAEAMLVLRDADPASASRSVLAWSCALTVGLGLVAEGRLFPAVSPEGYDAWRVGPFAPTQLRLLAELAAAFPPSAHALLLSTGPPLRMPSPEALIRAAWDAFADTLVRTQAAIAVAGTALFAAVDPQPAAYLRPWLGDAARGLEGGATIALRIELDDDAPRAVLQLTSRTESSLVVDAVELLGAPASVLARFGEDAESDLLLTLRRGARAWPPLEELLHRRVPTELALDDDMLGELLAEGATVLQGTGIEVLWPAEILHDGIELRASIVPAPGRVDEAGFDLGTLLAFRWQATLDGQLLSEEEINQLAEAKRHLIRLRGRWVAADPGLLERLRAGRPQRLTAAEALGALLAGSVELDGNQVPVVAEGPLGELAVRLERLGEGSLGDLDPPHGLLAELRPYQARGVAWLREMATTGLGGCLADDMGLGKTLQVIALHLHRSENECGPTLVVCPTSLLGNWEREIRRFAPSIPVRRYHGGGRHLSDIASDELVVTSYGVVRLDHENLGEAGFTLVVADEAQHAKNPHSATARSLRAIPAKARVALTGTPVENRLSDLWSILDWTTPGLLGPLERFV